MKRKEPDAVIDGDDEDVVASPLTLRNPVAEFDGRVQLYEHGRVTLADGSVIDANHTYVVNGRIGYTSTTTMIKQYFDKFDPVLRSSVMVSSRKWQWNHEYRVPAESWAGRELARRWQDSGSMARETSGWTEALQQAAAQFVGGSMHWQAFHAELLRDSSSSMGQGIVQAMSRQFRDLCAEHIRTSWTERANLGTAMHERIERYYEGLMTRAELEARGEPELQQLFKWNDDWLVPEGYEAWRMELRWYDDALRCTGSIDALFRHRKTGKLIMVDWKRSKEIRRTGFNGATGTGPFADLEDCNYIHYVLQQSMYRHMLEKHTPFRITDMYLLICHPTQGADYQLLPLEYKLEHIKALYAAQNVPFVQHLCPPAAVHTTDE